MIDAYRLSGRLPDAWEGVAVERPFFPRIGDLVRVVKRVAMFTVNHIGDIGRVVDILGGVYVVVFLDDVSCQVHPNAPRAGGTCLVCGLFFITELAPVASTRFDAELEQR